MMSETKSPLKKNDIIRSIFPKKSMLCSSDDFTKMAELSTRAKLIKQVIAKDDTVSNSLGKQYSKVPEPLPLSKNELTDCNQQYTAYRSKIGLRWNPCVEVSSGDDMPIQLPERPTNRCNCNECTSIQCPSKQTAGLWKSVFKDNIVRFRDNFTMTPKLNHASCSARTPIASPKSSYVALEASQTQTKFDPGYYSQPPQAPPPNPNYRKPILRNEFFPESWYDEQVSRDTGLNDQEECPMLKRAYNRHCVSHHPDLQFETGKLNLYNEGISEKVAEQYPISPSSCPHRVRFGSRSFCRNTCPDCSCSPPFADASKYHQKCKRPVYQRPVYYDYDMDPDEVEHFVAIPRIVTERYVLPLGRPDRAPAIILPKKVLTSERDIDTFVKDQKSKRRIFRKSK